MIAVTPGRRAPGTPCVLNDPRQAIPPYDAKCGGAETPRPRLLDALKPID